MIRWPRVLRERPIASVSVFCLLVIALLVVRNLVNVVISEQDPRLRAIRQAGYPVTLAELNAYYPAVPDAENAALVYLRTFQLELVTNSIFEDLARDLNLKRGEAVPAKVRDSLAAALATDAAAWQLLYSATNLTAARYPLDLREGHMVLLPHLANIKQAVALLSLEGLSHASADEPGKAYAAFNAAFQAGESIRDEPILISFLVRIACSAQIVKRLEQSLNLVPFRDDQLRSLQERFAAAEDPHWAARALAGERAFGLSFLIDRRIQRSITLPQQGVGVVPSGFAGQLALSVYRASGLMAKDRTFYLEAMGNSVARAELPAHERIKAGPPPSMLPTNRFLIFSRMLLPALQRTLDRANEHAARMRVVETALGVERFRLAHAGALPENLQQLAPQHLRAVPLDPFDSQPLRYRKLPHGYVVYSVGPDRKDDGGVEPPSPDNTGIRPTPPARDVAFVVERQ